MYILVPGKIYYGHNSLKISVEFTVADMHQQPATGVFCLLVCQIARAVARVKSKHGIYTTLSECGCHLRCACPQPHRQLQHDALLVGFPYFFNQEVYLIHAIKSPHKVKSLRCDDCKIDYYEIL